MSKWKTLKVLVAEEIQDARNTYDPSEEFDNGWFCALEWVQEAMKEIEEDKK